MNVRFTFAAYFALFVLISSVYGRGATLRSIGKNAKGNALIKIRQSDSFSLKNKGIFPVEVDISGLVNMVKQRFATIKTDMNAVKERSETCHSKVSSLENKVELKFAAIKSDMSDVKRRVETCISYVPPTQPPINPRDEIKEEIIPESGRDWGTVASKSFLANGYIFINDEVNHEEAEKRCHHNNAKLAAITSNEEFDFLEKHLTNGTTYWIGAKATGCEKVANCDNWFWEDGEPLPLKWKHGWKVHPISGQQLPYDNGRQDAYALAITRFESGTTTFINYGSTRNFSFICKVKKELD